ncbi:hypothetical protein ACJX0J_039393, partial [Zea mays]
TADAEIEDAEYIAIFADIKKFRLKLTAILFVVYNFKYEDNKKENKYDMYMENIVYKEILNLYHITNIYHIHIERERERERERGEALSGQKTTDQPINRLVIDVFGNTVVTSHNFTASVILHNHSNVGLFTDKTVGLLPMKRSITTDELLPTKRSVITNKSE